MRFVSVFLVLVLAAIVSAAPASDKPHYDVSNANALFEDFIKKYNRNYKDDADKDVHYHAFVRTLEEINAANARDTSATFDINDLSDYTDEQRKHLFGLRTPKN